MNRTAFTTMLDETEPLIIRRDNISDLVPALDGGYLPHWDDPAPIRPAPRSPFAAPPRPSFWKLYTYALLSSVGICLMAWALARLLERFL